MSLVCLIMGLRLSLFPPLNHDSESFTQGFGSRGGGGGYYYYQYDGGGGGAARILKTPPPIHIKAKPENHTYSYIFSKREPHGFCICTYDSLRLYPGPNSCAVFVCQLQFKPPYTRFYIVKLGSTGLLITPPPLFQP